MKKRTQSDAFMMGGNPKKRKLAPNPANSSADPAEPYPAHLGPTADACRAVRDDLMSLHGFPKEFLKYRRTNDRSQPSDATTEEEETVLDGLICTLLSQNTTDSNSRRAFASLKSVFPTWNDVLAAEAKEVEDAIRCGGLAAMKALRIRGLLRGILERKGEMCLEYLRRLPVHEVKAELSQFKGIGPKTVACVLMFQLQRDDFPVDTHVFRIAKSIGWIPSGADREKAYHHLNKRIPDDLKFDLNCLLVTHGKLCQSCAAKGRDRKNRAPHESCPLTRYCCHSE
ncbi:hypothetical protein QJS10_CPA05g01891 [Acorus calamus]|uniref:HhH-GPD domain-containing protein n=1 Tax=Acorus calamus TaxID=4465 RepID=A0AAV9EUE9_ACOCL|nr:hypothetical protein QJS10_CPA05g01891 [Acorus calamus]